MLATVVVDVICWLSTAYTTDCVVLLILYGSSCDRCTEFTHQILMYVRCLLGLHANPFLFVCNLHCWQVSKQHYKAAAVCAIKHHPVAILLNTCGKLSVSSAGCTQTEMGWHAGQAGTSHT
eukprot:GHRR01024823.1.p1 GENE.GHRR01024823.1~~GHRR01024823.1.p1  ORF type:complete len:121 (+),score=16.56 GHRR01024823.1:487-849(+)